MWYVRSCLGCGPLNTVTFDGGARRDGRRDIYDGVIKSVSFQALAGEPAGVRGGLKSYFNQS